VAGMERFPAVFTQFGHNPPDFSTFQAMTEPSAPQADSSTAVLADPIQLFNDWLDEARQLEPNDPDAMALATADASGFPDVRMVLLKGADARGFVFYTNLESDKAREIADNASAALCFHWKSLRRQVRVRGVISPVSNGEADAYFATRARDSQIGAWASRQSRRLAGRFELEKEVARFTAKFGLGKVPRPPFWSGYRVAPLRIEFWRNKPFRLHDRLVFERDDVSSGWTTSKLFP